MMIKKVEPSLTERIKDHIDAITTAVIQAIKPDRITIEYPRERRRYPEVFRGFIVFDKDRCISCFRCAQICPANAIKMEFYDKYYPSIDYTKCIFCHFCVDSCPTGALKTSKVHDVAFKSLEEMHLHTTQITKVPDIVREDKVTVEYEIKGGEWKLVRKKELDRLEVEVPPPVVKPKKASCKEPESCLGCRLCVAICPQEAIKFDREKSMIKIDVDKCVGCGLCVRQCPMQILELKVVE